MLSVGETARLALSLDMHPVLVAYGKKKPVHDSWETINYTEETIAEFDRPRTAIGLRWGEGHIDVDLETPEVAAVAEALLPPTGLRWGRQGLPTGHWAYATPTPNYKRVQVKSPDGELLAELRGLHNQSVIPPSIHPETGAPYEWYPNDVFGIRGLPQAMDVGELEMQVKEVVFTAVMAEAWPRMVGNRHNAMLGICGMLLKMGRTAERVRQIADVIIERGADPDPVDRRQIAASSAARLEAGEEVGGYTLVETALGEEVAKWAAKLFHLPVERLTAAGGVSLNDAGNSELFCQLFGDDLMYLAFKKDWCGWNGQYWELMNNGLLEQTKAKLTVKHMESIAGTLPTATERQAMRHHALRSGDAGAIAAMVKLSRDALARREGELDRDPWLFNVSNGTIDLRTGGLRGHVREDYITRMAGVEYGDVADCPQWISFLDVVFNHDALLINFIQRMCGYCLTGNTREQVMFFLYGHGKNGKTTFIEVMTSVLGDYAVRTPAETLIKKRDAGIPNDVARLRGARFVASKEVEQGMRLAENVVKDLTGGDTITARFLNGEWFDFRPVLKLVMYGNHKPTITGGDQGIWRRIKLIPFAVEIQDSIDDYAAKMVAAEGPAILRWCVEGCLQWQFSGLMTPEAVAEATSGYREEMDVIGQFLEERYVLVPAGKGKVLLETVFSEYNAWTMTNGERPITQRQLNMKLAERGLEKRKSNGRWFFFGLQSVLEAEVSARSTEAG